MMIDYTQLEALAAVLRLGSFDAASRALGVTPSAISQRIKQLEDQLGTVLILREKPCTGTDAGRRLARHAEAVGLLEQGLVKDLSGLMPARHATVRIAVNADSLATWFIPALAMVNDLLVDLVSEDQDHCADWLRRGEVLAAITGHPGPVQGCDSIPLGSLRYIATASPPFMARWFPDGVTARALARAPALTFDRKDRLQSIWVEREFGPGIALPTHHLPSSGAFVAAARCSIGWGMNPQVLVENALARGRLVALRPGAPLDIPLYWQFNRMISGALSPLSAAIRQIAGTALQPPAKAAKV